MLKTPVKAADADTHEDIMRTVQFAKDIDASKLQPAILTPFPGTPVYEGYEKESRMLVRDECDWEPFDMMNATYQPKNMSPWDLEMEFFHAACSFYDRRGAIRMGKTFGPAYGLTRYALALIARLGKWGTWLAGVVGKGSWYYYLRHIPWRYAMDHESDEIGHELKLLRRKDDAQEVATTLAVLAALVSPVARRVRRLMKDGSPSLPVRQRDCPFVS